MYISDLSPLEIRSQCLSLQCGNDPRFGDVPCANSLNPICLYTVNSVESKFKTSYPFLDCKLKAKHRLTMLTLKAYLRVHTKLQKSQNIFGLDSRSFTDWSPHIPMWQN